MQIKQIGSISVEELLKKNEKEDEKCISSINLQKKELTKEELKEVKKENRFYLPVLRINQLEQWPPIPKSQRKHFTAETARKTCLSNCCDVPGLKSACCRMDPDDLEHVLGPLDEKWIKHILKWFKNKGIDYRRQDIVIDFEEGKILGQTFFNGHRVFEDPKSYPILRFQVDGSHFSCKFLNNSTGMCGIYLERPNMCKNYLCNYVKSNFLVKTKEKPNTWVCLNTPKEEIE